MREWLQELRNERGMTHEYVAILAGIKRAYYTMIENGTRNPSVEVAKRIAEVLGFKWTIFFEKQGSVTTHNGLVATADTGTDG